MIVLFCYVGGVWLNWNAVTIDDIYGRRVAVMMLVCVNFLLILHEWRKEEFQKLFSYDYKAPNVGFWLLLLRLAVMHSH